MKHKNSKGATLVEYALLVALISVVCISAVTTVGKNARCTFVKVDYSIENGRPFIPENLEEDGVETDGCH